MFSILQLTKKDGLTGLLNRQAYYAETSKSRKDITAIVSLDMNGLKKVNDTYGHDVGDSVLKELGNYLYNKFTNEEIVGRFGGDEFVIFLKNEDNADIALKIAQEIVNESSEQVTLPSDEVKFSVNIGMAIYHGEEKNYSELFKKADIALYKTKADRKIKYNLYQDK